MLQGDSGPEAERQGPVHHRRSPQRDTPGGDEGLSLELRSARITGLTGTHPRRSRRSRTEYKAYAKAVPDKDGTYTMDHTAITYLMDKKGLFVSGFNLDRSPRQKRRRS